MYNEHIQDISQRSESIAKAVSMADAWHRAVSFTDTKMILFGVGGQRETVEVDNSAFVAFKTLAITGLTDSLNDQVTAFNTAYPEIAFTRLDDVADFEAEPHESMNIVILTWSAVTGATGYKIFKQMAATADSEFTKAVLITTVDAVGLHDTNVFRETDYNYFVVATSPDKLDSETPAAVSVTTPEWDA